jgi:hypothetical protein
MVTESTLTKLHMVQCAVLATTPLPGHHTLARSVPKDIIVLPPQLPLGVHQLITVLKVQPH